MQTVCKNVVYKKQTVILCFLKYDSLSPSTDAISIYKTLIDHSQHAILHFTMWTTDILCKVVCIDVLYIG